MEIYQGAFLIISVWGVVMLIVASKTNSHIILNIVLRSILGSLLIFAVNQWGKMEGYPMLIGLNSFTVLTSSILGFPGIALLYGIKIYSLL